MKSRGRELVRRGLTFVVAAQFVLAAMPVQALAATVPARALAAAPARARALTPQAVACTIAKGTNGIPTGDYNSVVDAFNAVHYELDSEGKPLVSKTRNENATATIRLAANDETLELREHIEVVHDVTLDLNGATLTIDFEGTSDPNFSSDFSFAPGFLVHGGASGHGKLTIIDSSSEKTGKVVVKNAGVAVRCQAGGAVVIQSGRIQVPLGSEGRHCVECVGGHLTIEGGNFNNERQDPRSISSKRPDYGMGCVYLGSETGSTPGLVTIKGGTFTCQNNQYYAISQYAGTMEISSVSSLSPTTVSSSAGSVGVYGGLASIAGGSFEGVTNCLFVIDGSYLNAKFEGLTVTGGTFTSNGGGNALLIGKGDKSKELVTVEGGTFNGTIARSPATTAMQLFVRGGTWSDQEHLEAGNYIQHGYMLEVDKNGDVKRDAEGRVTVVADPNAAPEEEDGKKVIGGNMVTLQGSTRLTYNGSTQEPAVTVVSGSTTLRKDRDYTVTYSNNTNVGTALVTITGIGDWGGKVMKAFTIEARSIVGGTLSFGRNPAGYVSGQDPDPQVRVSLSDGTVLSPDTDYTIHYEVNEFALTATAQITAKGNYSGSLSGNFTITRGLRVRFLDGLTGDVIGEDQIVPSGTAAVPPTPPEHDGYAFDSWDTDLECILSDCVVTAKYVNATMHTVRFVDSLADIELIASVQVKDGQDAEPPTPPVHPGYTFVNWDSSYRTVRTDLTVATNYARTGDGEIRTIPSALSDTAKGTIVEHADGTASVIALDYDDQPVKGWARIGGAWYLCGNNGYALSGRQEYGGALYYFDPKTCKLRTGWIEDTSAGGWMWANTANGDQLGQIARGGWFHDGSGWFLASDSGVIRTGWVYVDAAWYYLEASGSNQGRMATRWLNDGGSWYWLGTDGVLLRSAWLWDGAWYWLAADGAMATGWLWQSGWYYFGTSGQMTTGWQWMDGDYYCFREDGTLVQDAYAEGYWMGHDGRIVW